VAWILSGFDLGRIQETLEVEIVYFFWCLILKAEVVMTVDEYKVRVLYVRGSSAPRCSSCRHAVKTKGLRCMDPVAVQVIGGFAVRPDSWCGEWVRKEDV
jgi:hypothetical protein